MYISAHPCAKYTKIMNKKKNKKMLGLLLNKSVKISGEIMYRLIDAQLLSTIWQVFLHFCLAYYLVYYPNCLHLALFFSYCHQ